MRIAAEVYYLLWAFKISDSNTVYYIATYFAIIYYTYCTSTCCNTAVYTILYYTILCETILYETTEGLLDIEFKSCFRKMSETICSPVLAELLQSEEQGAKRSDLDLKFRV